MPADDEAARLAIFEKYEAGREGGVEVEDWEDPNLELYAVTDRYGFMHKEVLPPTHPSQKDLDVMRQRALKWKKMLDKWDTVVQTSVMHRRVLKGVPDSVRLEVWSRFLDLKSIRKPGQYEAAYYAARERGKLKDIDQINKDIARRFREHVLFRERYGQGQQILFRILSAYTMYNEEVGYCQGMDAIAGLMMMYMNEEDAYWAMCRLMSSEHYAMHGLYTSDLRKLHEMCTHHGTIRRKVLPKVHKHLEQVGFEPTLYGTKWFMEGFQERLPFPLVLRVWDVYLYVGERVMHAMAALLIKMFKKQMAKQSFEQLHIFMKELPDHKFDNDEVMEQLDLMLQDLRKHKLASFPRATSLTFLPSTDPPAYPVPPEEYRDLTLRREHRRTVKSLPPGVGLERQSVASSVASGSSQSEGPTSPGADSIVSAPGMLPGRNSAPADHFASAAATAYTSPGVSMVSNGSSLPPMSPDESDDVPFHNEALQAAAESLAEVNVLQATSEPIAGSIPSDMSRPSDLPSSDNAEAAAAEAAQEEEDETTSQRDAATPTAQVPNGGLVHEKAQLEASNSDSSLRIRVSAI
ncbi:USP6 N-terminal-like protein [Sycon ciliatum]|uniref:USP6 N-terminal-like protein n=1 Tax=Sycon ciliatum TaxID=27933 RepID=UPI0020A9DF46|eukprot:scpid31734/ scgid30710/ USP6 N-terminal-like protein